MIDGIKAFSNIGLNYPSRVVELHSDLVKGAMAAFSGTESMRIIQEYWFVYPREGLCKCPLNYLVSRGGNTQGAFLLAFGLINVNSADILEFIGSLLELFFHTGKPLVINSIQGLFWLRHAWSHVSGFALDFFVGIHKRIFIRIVSNKLTTKYDIARICFTQFS